MRVGVDVGVGEFDGVGVRVGVGTLSGVGVRVDVARIAVTVFVGNAVAVLVGLVVGVLAAADKVGVAVLIGLIVGVFVAGDNVGVVVVVGLVVGVRIAADKVGDAVTVVANFAVAVLDGLVVGLNVDAGVVVFIRTGAFVGVTVGADTGIEPFVARLGNRFCTSARGRLAFSESVTAAVSGIFVMLLYAVFKTSWVSITPP